MLRIAIMIFCFFAVGVAAALTKLPTSQTTASVVATALTQSSTAAEPTASAQSPAAAQSTASFESTAAVETAAPVPSPAPVETAATAQSPALAQGCPGNPDALGTSRTITVDPTALPRVGTIQYRDTVPLKDHEVVLTFDDGPIPPYTTRILELLAEQCVKVTYFLVGEMAGARPYLVRRIYNEGHSIGTHSQNHPRAFQHLSMQRVTLQVASGIESVDNALGDPKALSPFFRIPGLGRTNAIEEFLESKGLMTWSVDIDTYDWRRGSSPGAIVQRAMRQLNAKGKGIILMHDIHPATVLALPMLLKELKTNGYRIVHVEVAGERPKSLPDLPAPAVADNGNWPRVVMTKVASDDDKPGKSLRHRARHAHKASDPDHTASVGRKRHSHSVRDKEVIVSIASKKRNAKTAEQQSSDWGLTQR